MFGFGVVILVTITEADGIKTEVIVQMALIQMGGHNDLKIPAPHLFGKLNSDSMAFLCGNLSRLEALISVKRDVPVSLVILLLGQDHLLNGGLFQAVDGGDILPLRCGFRPLDVTSRVPEIGQVGEREQSQKTNVRKRKIAGKNASSKSIASFPA